MRPLFILLGLLALGRSAGASDCHAPERPALGMATPGVGEEARTFDDQPRAPEFRHNPCPGEVPGAPARSLIPDSIPAERCGLEVPPYPEFSMVVLSDLPPSPAGPTPLARPPRIALRSLFAPQGARPGLAA